MYCQKVAKTMSLIERNFGSGRSGRSSSSVPAPAIQAPRKY
jgi:hypothetical protein